MKNISGNRENRIYKDNRGFTLLETLLVVAIIAVLLGLSIIGVIAIQKELRQRELDSKAEMIYMAAQNRMTELTAGGRAELYSPGAADVYSLGLIPLDSEDENRTEDSLYYVKSDQIGSGELSTAAVILPESRIEKEIRDCNWVIEYDPASGSIYGVFYSEKDMEYIPADFNNLRSKQMRKQAGAWIGYYGGDAVISIDTNVLNPKLQIYNEETLHAVLSCNQIKDGNVSFEVKIEDRFNHSVTEKINTADIIRKGATLSYDIVFDKLTDGQRFKDKYPTLAAGSDITITFTARSDNDFVDSASVTGKTNSLFASSENGNTTVDTAIITYCRHLQNLDADSGLNKYEGYVNFKKAVQRSNLHFENDEENIDDWYSIYGAGAYKAIDNSLLYSYSGSYNDGGELIKTVIYGLDTKNGMFDEFKGIEKTWNDELAELKDITLSGAKITGGSYAGALAGKVTGSGNHPVKIIGCQVYLSEAEGDLAGRDENGIWISGSTYTGGLIGHTSGNIVITDSFAATVAGTSDSDYTGGLVGYAEGALQLKNSYADCYLYGKNAGGLIGSAKDGCRISITDCYSAGYITADSSAAGFVPQKAEVMKNSYSAVAYIDKNNKYADEVYATAAAKGTLSKVYYLNTAGIDSDKAIGESKLYKQMSNRAEFVNSLGDKFTASTGGNFTAAYNFMKQGLTDYSFPRLANLLHYGDWKADFEDNRPVYYEVYTKEKINGETYGIYGANLDTLEDNTSAAGDGYGIIYSSSPAADVKLRYDGSKEITLKKNSAERISVGTDTYWILKFPKEVVNTTNASPDFYQEIIIDGVSYYYNPHFAKTVTSEKPDRVSNVYVRTARQLYNLSLYYDKYEDKTKKSTYIQENDIYYGKYMWTEYAGVGAVTEQSPIGKGDKLKFSSSYDGGCHIIDGVSFVSGRYYAGMFGYNGGILKNIALVSDYGDNDRYVSISSKIEGSKAKVYIGALAGYNSKTIRNCAAAGYSFKLYTYRSSSLHAGGLVGSNNGSVRNSSADCPEMKISQTYANVSAGGFAGGNTGNISGCYSLGRVDIIESKQGDTTAAGFTGENAGVISNAYCAVSITISGSAKGCGFAPAGGTVKNDCRYLDKGTYYYAEELNAYNIAAGDKRADSVNSAQLKALVNDKNRAGKSLYHGKTTETDYPYPAAVKKDKEYIHYGNWPVEIELGNTGVFYWEHEEGGPNAGYHFRYLGVAGNNGVGGSSLCTAHNDGGIVKEFGYGYYYKEGSNATVSMTDFGANPKKNDEASTKIKDQLSGYKVTAYTTGNNAGELYLDKKENNKPVKIDNGKWALTYTENGKTSNYVYTLCPFFADAFKCDSVTATTGYEGNTAVPGTKDNRYKVRSAEQLQYINWNCSTLNATTYVQNGSNFDNPNSQEKYGDTFTYLRYASKNSSGENGYNYYWNQSHDIDKENIEDSKPDDCFTPIGSMFYTKGFGLEEDNRGTAYIAYFAGSYTGESYAIKNLTINTTVPMVGLFGVTIGAELRDIVMYSENENLIKISNANGDKTNKWYCVGGLVGFAARGTGNTNPVIENCTVSGYSIIDARSRDGGWGGGSVGGLAGASNMDISGCTAVNDITISVSYNGGYKNIRTGGLVGNCRAAIDGCYSGGVIESTTETYGNYHSSSTNIWIGGITGGVVMINYGNLSELVGPIDNDVYVKNSYSYAELPESGKHQVRTVHSVASNGEAQSSIFGLNNIPKPDMNIVNCYAYENNVKNSDDYKNRAGLNYDNTVDIKNGNQSHVYLTNSGKSPYVTYEQLSAAQGTAGSVADLLNNNGEMPKTVEFGFVTSIENGASIDGKYSFPGDDASLEGVNYPFPTVLTQKNTFGDTVNVHYGIWPKGILYWQNSMKSFDMLEQDSLEMNLIYQGTGTAPALNQDTFKFLDEDGNELTDSPLAFKSCDFITDRQMYRVVFTALKEGTVTVRAEDGNTIADTLVSITANLLITAEPAELNILQNSDTELSFTVKSVNNTNDFTKAVKWEIEADDEAVVSYEQPVYNAAADKWTMKVTGLKSGETTSIKATAKYEKQIDGKIRVFEESVVILVNVTENNSAAGE